MIAFKLIVTGIIILTSLVAIEATPDTSSGFIKFLEVFGLVVGLFLIPISVLVLVWGT